MLTEDGSLTEPYAVSASCPVPCREPSPRAEAGQLSRLLHVRCVRLFSPLLALLDLKGAAEALVAFCFHQFLTLLSHSNGKA